MSLTRTHTPFYPLILSLHHLALGAATLIYSFIHAFCHLTVGGVGGTATVAR